MILSSKTKYWIPTIKICLVDFIINYAINLEKNELKLENGMYTWCTQFSLSALMLFKSTQKNVKFDNLIEMLF